MAGSIFFAGGGAGFAGAAAGLRAVVPRDWAARDIVKKRAAANAQPPT